MRYRTRENEMLDQICAQHYGQTLGVVEQVLNVNPHLANCGALLPEGILIDLPPLPQQLPLQQTLQLWD